MSMRIIKSNINTSVWLFDNKIILQFMAIGQTIARSLACDFLACSDCLSTNKQRLKYCLHSPRRLLSVFQPKCQTCCCCCYCSASCLQFYESIWSNLCPPSVDSFVRECFLLLCYVFPGDRQAKLAHFVHVIHVHLCRNRTQSGN